MGIPPSDIDVTGPTILGKEAAGAGVAEEISPTDTTAMLDAMVGDSGAGGTKGLVPAPSAGDAAAFKFLKADGTWASAAPDTVAAFVYLDTDQTLTDNVETAISFTDEVFDTDNLWASSPNPTRLTVPSDGIYAVRGKIALNSSFIGVATVRIYATGAMAASFSGAGQNLSANNESHEVSALLDLTAGDYLELKVLLEPTVGSGSHDVTGGNSTVTTFAAFKVASQGGAGGGIETTADTFANRPAGAEGDLFFPTDAQQIQRRNGSAWQGWGPIVPLTAPSTTGYAWVNQGGATLTAAKDAFFFASPAEGSGDNLHFYLKTAPATPYTITALLLVNLPSRSYLRCGLAWRESSSGKAIVFGLIGITTDGLLLALDRFNSATSYNSQETSGYFLSLSTIVLRLHDDGTNRVASWSADGINFIEFFSTGRTSFITADQVGFVINSTNAGAPNVPVAMTILSLVGP